MKTFSSLSGIFFRSDRTSRNEVIQFQSRTGQGIAIFKLAGHLALDSARSIEETIEEFLRSGDRKFILDMIDVRDISSSVIGKLLEMYRKIQSKSGALALADLSPVCLYVLDLAGMMDFFPIFSSVEEAALSI